MAEKKWRPGDPSSAAAVDQHPQAGIPSTELPVSHPMRSMLNKGTLLTHSMEPLSTQVAQVQRNEQNISGASHE